MSAVDLVRNLKVTIRTLVGLHVVATVCDQHGTNGKAIKMLSEETERKHKGTENRLFCFTINGEELVPLYDRPHLLKGVRNNFLEGNVTFSWKKEKQIGCWKDFTDLYELDSGDADSRMLNKLTDSHVYKSKLKKMKGKLAAQVFSQRVSATMRGLAKHG